MTVHIIELLRGLRNNCDLVIDSQRLQEWVTRAGRTGCWRRALVFVVIFFRNCTMRWVDMILEELIHSECCCANCALVRQMGGFQCHIVIARNMIEKLPLEHLKLSFWNWNLMIFLLLISFFSINSPSRRLDSGRSLFHCSPLPASMRWRDHASRANVARDPDRWRIDIDIFGNSTADDCKSFWDGSAIKSNKK